VTQEAAYLRSRDDVRVTAQAAVSAYEVWQLADGRAAWLNRNSGASQGDRIPETTIGQVTMPKAAGVVLLDGGDAYWSWANNWISFQKVDSRDFYAGKVVGDAASADTVCTVNLNVSPPPDLDLLRDPYTPAPTGTQALGGFLPPQRNGGALTFTLSATAEAQKVDALGKDGFAAGGACAVVEAVFNVINGGAAAAPDFNVGVASATHATDADAIAQHLFCHLDGNSTAIKFQSKDGTNTTAATDSTKAYAAGAGNANRVEVWFDLRDMTSVKIYVNGVRVLSGTTFNLSAAALRWLPLVHLEKTVAADQFQIDVERVRVRFAQQRG
jgi:hypothetical protein